MFNFQPEISSLTPAETATKIKENNVAFIDVRSQEEYNAGHARGATNIPLETLGGTTLKNFDVVYVICQSGVRSARAVSQLVSAGIHAVNVSGGTLEWRSEGLPME